jgi:D-alanyl-D-alanine carboxypeptidase (penicillin-binding protein 5/6)
VVPNRQTRSRKQIYRRRRTVIFGTAIVAVSAAVYLPLTLLAPVDTVAAEPVAYVTPASSPAQLALPDYGASGIAAVGTDGLLASSGATDPLPIASISKIVTALVVLDTKPIADGTDGETLEFTSKDVQIYNDYLADNGSVKAVSAGDSLSQREVLELMLVGSANNYSQSLVNWAFGSEREYAAAATQWLADNSMTSTTITDATGMSPLNTSTPADLVILGELAIANPIVAEIVAQKSITVGEVGTFGNTNKLLGVDGIDGIKTGTLDEAGACLLFSADVLVGDQTITLVGVVLGGEDHPTVDTTVRTLVEGVMAGYQQVTLTTAGEPFASYTTAWGDTTEVVAAEDSSMLVWSDTPITASVSTEDISFVENGDEVGSVSFVSGTQQVEIPLITTGTIDDPGAAWRLTNPGELF